MSVNLGSGEAEKWNANLLSKILSIVLRHLTVGKVVRSGLADEG